MEEAGVEGSDGWSEENGVLTLLAKGEEFPECKSVDAISTAAKRITSIPRFVFRRILTTHHWMTGDVLTTTRLGRRFWSKSEGWRIR